MTHFEHLMHFLCSIANKTLVTDICQSFHSGFILLEHFAYRHRLLGMGVVKGMTANDKSKTQAVINMKTYFNLQKNCMKLNSL